MKKYIAIIFGVAFLFSLISCENGSHRNSGVAEKIFEDLEVEDFEEDNKDFSQGFISYGLKTDTDKKSISLDMVLSGGPEKDGIPAINTPKFYSIKEAEDTLDFLNDESTGIAVGIAGEAKFYPYNILVWHEIVNDSVGGKDIVVTFCPLCGSAVVYDRKVNGELLEFGVSGKLYESNLLMYDTLTESLWSQSIGEAVVGEKIGDQLEYVKSNLLSFAEFKNNYKTGKVLSDQTGFRRDYTRIPYGNYTENESLYFPVKNSDERFHAKEMFYIVNNSQESVAFLLKDLREQKKAEITIGNDSYSAVFNNGIIDVDLNGEKLAGYYEMWFSWVTHNKGSKNVWKKE